jgi:hypothetical protein
MFGILSQNSRLHVMVDGIDLNFGSNQPLVGTGPSGGFGTVPISNSSTTPLQKFDISVLSGLRDSDKYLGKNRVSDIKEAYQSYISESVIGRGGQYGVDAARRYGTSVTEALRGYLATVGLPTLQDVLPTNTTNPTNPVETTNPVKPPDTVVKEKNTFEVLADILPGLFGNAVYNPPLQSQAYGYTPTDSQTPLQSGGSSIVTFIIIGVVGVIGYFVYKRYVK